MRKKCILLGLIEAMNFIDEKDRPASVDPTSLLRGVNHLAQLGQAARDGRELLEVRLRV